MSGFATKLTIEQQHRIIALAAPGPDGKRLTPHRIAKIIGETRETVGWFMYRNGLRRPVIACTESVPNAAGRRRFTKAEDDFMLEMRVAGHSARAIAAAMEQRFGHPRMWRSVKVRLILLAGFDAEAEDRAEMRIERRAA